MQLQAIQTRTFGKTGRHVSMVGLGGEGILRTHGQDSGAHAVIAEGLEQGLTYYDCARAYAGSERYYGMVWGARPEAREQVFQASKSAQRSKASALADLQQTLTNMHIEHLDLWQIHDVRQPTTCARSQGRTAPCRLFWRLKRPARRGLWG